MRNELNTYNITIIPDIAADLILILMVRDICYVHVKEIA